MKLHIKGYKSSRIAKQVRTSEAMIDKFYNHVQPILIDEFSSVGEVRDDDEISKLLRTVQNDDMLHFAEMCSGITLSLAMQNKPALDTLRDELAKKKNQAS